MSAIASVPKKPKVYEDKEVKDLNHDGEDNSKEEQEEALVALIEHRTKEVEHIKQRILHYTNQLAEAEKSLQDSQTKLVRLRGQEAAASSRSFQANGTKTMKEERGSKNPRKVSDEPNRNLPLSKKEVVIPSENPKIKTVSVAKSKAEKSRSGWDAEGSGIRDRGTKRKSEQKEHKELIRLIGKSSTPTCTIKCHVSNEISSQHKRKLRSLVLCSANDQLFVTSALDGVVSLWQLQTGRLAASLLSTTDCLSPKQRRWPEDVAWHPHGNSLFSVYTADAGDSQISILNLNKTQGRARLTFLEDKPHVKGIINSIMFMPWENTCFVTGGSDHAVVLWNEKEENQWKPKPLHRNLHSAAVTGVAGMIQKNIVLSVGADKRIYGYDVQVGRADYKHQVEYKCMSVLPNPCDFNLFVVQSGQPEKQLGLYDIRLRNTELQSFGWKQDSSDSQSALINQSWSPDGLYITSGSADPVIHIFDIRYNAHKPSQSIRAHQKRVFKAEWHHSQPLLISISSDLNIGLHRVS